jgi:hypothetical protein
VKLRQVLREASPAAVKLHQRLQGFTSCLVAVSLSSSAVQFY